MIKYDVEHFIARKVELLYTLETEIAILSVDPEESEESRGGVQKEPRVLPRYTPQRPRSREEISPRLRKVRKEPGNNTYRVSALNVSSLAISHPRISTPHSNTKHHLKAQRCIHTIDANGQKRRRFSSTYRKLHYTGVFKRDTIKCERPID